jgi:YD repeat-containing protein
MQPIKHLSSIELKRVQSFGLMFLSEDRSSKLLNPRLSGLHLGYLLLILLLGLPPVVKADFPMTPYPSWCRGANTPCTGLYVDSGNAPLGPYASPEAACLSFWSGRESWVLGFLGIRNHPGTGTVPESDTVDVYGCDWSTIYGAPDSRALAVRDWTCPTNARIVGDPYFYGRRNYRCRCDDGYQETSLGGCTKKQEDPAKNFGPPGLCTLHPINIGNGVKYLSNPIYQSALSSSLNIHLHYNAPRTEISNLNWHGRHGWLWSSDYEQRIKIYQTNDNQPVKIGLRLSNGREWKYLAPAQGDIFIEDADVNDSVHVIRDAQGNIIQWIHTTHQDGVIETYDANGVITSITDKSGMSQKITYSDFQGQKYPSDAPVCRYPLAADPYKDKVKLNCVTDSLGNQINYTYDASRGLIKTMTNPAGGVYSYGYDANNNLKSVTYPDGKIKTYHYGEVTHVSTKPATGVSKISLLTGISDENGNRYANYYYDAQGKAYAENLAGLADDANLVFNTDASGNPTNTVVTDAGGNVNKYSFTTILGVVKTTGQSQPAGSGCSASSSNITYDANGNVASRTDFDGHKTTYQYDLNRNLETSRTEGLTAAGLTTDATRTITTTWHATWSLPLVMSEYSGATNTGTPLKRTAYTYDDRGNLTSFTESDPVLKLNRTTAISYTYSTAVTGLVIGKVVDGPRTDVNDITTYNYYPHDAVCTPSSAPPIVDPVTGLSPDNLGCRGQLKSVKNALNQTTSYDRYNHHGQVEQMTDANGLVTTMTYDLRQRLTSRTVGTETTTLTYDHAGQVIQLQMPDSSALNYSYDAAHRLVQVQDSLGNKVSYTLDAKGNRIKEDTTDPKGTLAKTLTRSYDALNRLQTVTGIE